MYAIPPSACHASRSRLHQNGWRRRWSESSEPTEPKARPDRSSGISFSVDETCEFDQILAGIGAEIHQLMLRHAIDAVILRSIRFRNSGKRLRLFCRAKTVKTKLG